MTQESRTECAYFWGSHGCTLGPEHADSVHECRHFETDQICSQYDAKRARVRYWDPDLREFSDWYVDIIGWDGPDGL